MKAYLKSFETKKAQAMVRTEGKNYLRLFFLTRRDTNHCCLWPIYASWLNKECPEVPLRKKIGN